MTANPSQELEQQEFPTSARLTREREPGQENAVSRLPYVPPRTGLEAVKELPRQYLNVLMKPSAEKFAQEMGKARWSLVGVQFLLYLLTSLAFSLLVSGQPSLRDVLGARGMAGLNMPVSVMVWTLFEFLVSMGLFYLVARMFRGQGTILTQSYTLLLLNVPVELLNLVGLGLCLIPLAGVALFWIWLGAWSIYSMVLLIYALMAVHRLSGGKATGVFFLVSVLLGVGFILLSRVLP
jgi:hypothetical protein